MTDNQKALLFDIYKVSNQGKLSVSIGNGGQLSTSENRTLIDDISALQDEGYISGAGEGVRMLNGKETCYLHSYINLTRKGKEFVEANK